MSINQKKAEGIISYLYNYVENVSGNRGLSIEERLACDLLKAAITEAFNEFDNVQGKQGLYSILDQCTKDKPAPNHDHVQMKLEGRVNHILMDKQMLSNMLVAINTKTIADEVIHISDNGVTLAIIAETNYKESYLLTEMPSLFIPKHKKTE